MISHYMHFSSLINTSRWLSLASILTLEVPMSKFQRPPVQSLVSSLQLLHRYWGPWHGCTGHAVGISQISHHTGLDQLSIGTYLAFPSQWTCLVWFHLSSLGPLILEIISPFTSLHQGNVHWRGTRHTKENIG